MDITLTIPDEKKDNIINAFANQYGYQTEVEDGEGNMIPNPQTKPQFAKEKLINFVKEIYRASKANEADSARQTAISSADTYTEDLTIN